MASQVTERRLRRLEQQCRAARSVQAELTTLEPPDPEELDRISYLMQEEALLITIDMAAMGALAEMLPPAECEAKLAETVAALRARWQAGTLSPRVAERLRRVASSESVPLGDLACELETAQHKTDESNETGKTTEREAEGTDDASERIRQAG